MTEVLQLITMISTDVYPLSALHHTGPLQDVVVGLPLHLMLEGTHLTLCFSICQIPCRVEENTAEKQHGFSEAAYFSGIAKKCRPHPRQPNYSASMLNYLKMGGLLYLLQALELA